MTTIIQNVAVLDPAVLWSKKKSGTPISTAVPKQMSCRFVSPNMTLDFTFVRSFGTVTYANLSILLLYWPVILKIFYAVKNPFVVHPPLKVPGDPGSGRLLVDHHIGVISQRPQGVDPVEVLLMGTAGSTPCGRWV